MPWIRIGSKYREDRTHGMHRIESALRAMRRALGPSVRGRSLPTGQRYCINSASLSFQKPTSDNSKQE